MKIGTHLQIETRSRRLDEMVEAGLVYTVRDRSLLLPHYKRLFVEPFLRALPKSLDPNAITHAGHAVNFAGVVVLLAFGQNAEHGAWPMVLTALCLQLYNWCDNADGAHARRVGRCSAMGELLDHGLDMLNTTYVAFIAAIAIGAPPLWWTALALVVPAACAITYWEQAETGLFSLGVLNQIESVTTLTLVLGVSALFGPAVWDRVHVGPVTARLAMMGFVCATATAGILHNLWRVTRKQGASSLVRVAPLVVFDVAVLVAASTGAMSTVAAVTVGTAANVFFGLRSLAMRTSGEKPRLEAGVVVGAALVVGLVAWKLSGHDATRALDVTASVAATTFFGVLAVANAREARRAVKRLDREAAARATA